MKVGMFFVLVLAASASPGPVLAQVHADDNGTPEQQRDCTGDAMVHCGPFLFAPDRNVQIGNCLWLHRTEISKECRAHLRPPLPPPPPPPQRRPAPQK
jgi:hypothetical protein